MSSSSMRIRLLAFGSLKPIASAGGDWRELIPGQSVADLLATLCHEGLTDEAALRSAAIAVNQRYTSRTHTLHDGDEVAILPPVSGGAPTPHIALVREPIDSAAIQRSIKSPPDGALCVFDGIVRDNTLGRRPSRRALRRLPLAHRHPQKNRPHLEARAVRRRRRLGRRRTLPRRPRRQRKMSRALRAS